MTVTGTKINSYLCATKERHKKQKSLIVFGFPSNCNFNKKTRELEGYQLTPIEAWALVVFDKASGCCSPDGFVVSLMFHVSF